MNPDSRVEILRQAIRDVPDFPKPGIVFKDITPLLAQPEAFQAAVDLIAEQCVAMKAQKVLGIDARGFLFGAAAAYKLGLGLIIARKKGKLPYKTEGVSYSLEYGEATIEMHVDSVEPGERVVLIDDLLATGGTARAALDLVERLGGQPVGALFVVELGFLNGRQVLGDTPVVSFLDYSAE
ncbi:MAG: adenine phosphoribosyltransferase [Verrucomicrobiales bacterium]